MSEMTQERRPLGFPADTAPSIAGQSYKVKCPELIATISNEFGPPAPPGSLFRPKPKAEGGLLYVFSVFL
jgi:hypothetical protein